MRAGADQNTIRSYQQNVREVEMRSQYFGGGYQKPNTSDPNVWVIGTGKDATLHSTGGSAGYARGTFASASTTPQTALSSDPYLPKYDTTIYAEEALHRLVEIHYRIGLLEESKKYANMLGYNYNSSEWYKKPI